MKLKFDQIRIDGGTQIRAAINDEVIKEYCDAIKAGAQFPPLTVFYDGKDYWLADGFHRYRSFLESQIYELDIEVHNGTRRDAILYSVGANAEHGFPRSNADKRRAVMTLLNDDQWRGWSDHKIASQCHVDHKTVLALRESSLGKFPSDASKAQKSTCRKYIDKYGNQAVMNTKNIGKKRRDHAIPKISSKAMKPVLGHSAPGPKMIQVNLALENPDAAAHGIMSHCPLEFVKSFAEKLMLLVQEELEKRKEKSE